MLKKLKVPCPPRPCRHPEHNPPGMIVLSPGTYEHTCPACKKTTVFVVRGMYSLSSPALRGRCHDPL